MKGTEALELAMENSKTIESATYVKLETVLKIISSMQNDIISNEGRYIDGLKRLSDIIERNS